MVKASITTAMTRTSRSTTTPRPHSPTPPLLLQPPQAGPQEEEEGAAAAADLVTWLFLFKFSGPPHLKDWSCSMCGGLKSSLKSRDQPGWSQSPGVSLARPWLMQVAYAVLRPWQLQKVTWDSYNPTSWDRRRSFKCDHRVSHVTGCCTALHARASRFPSGLTCSAWSQDPNTNATAVKHKDPHPSNKVHKRDQKSILMYMQ